MRRLFCWLLFIFATALPLTALAETPKIGVVVMHGKGGQPGRFVDVLADGLERKGMLVANIEMPWSRARDYDAPVARAVEEVQAALAGLKSRGAQKLFVAGHSMGGTFALYFGGIHPVDGVIAIAPGGNIDNRNTIEATAPSLARARQLIEEGKGRERAQFTDFEGSRGTYPIMVAPEVYASWFDQAGPMNPERTAPALKAPILWGVAARDYPGLRRSAPQRFKAFPAHPMNKYFEPDSDHLNAPAASVEEVAAWVTAVAARP